MAAAVKLADDLRGRAAMLLTGGTNGVHAAGATTDPAVNGTAVPLGDIEPPRAEGVTLRLATVLRVLARTTAETCVVDRCSIFVPRGDVLIPIMAQFAGGTPRPELWQTFKALETKVALEAPGIVAEVLATRRPRMIVDVPNDPRVPADWKRFGAATLLLVPLVRDDAVVGLMVLDTTAPSIDARQRRRATQLARAVILAIDSPGSTREIRGRLRASETILNVGRTIGSTLELQEVVRRITREAAHAVRADSAGVYLMTENRDRLLPYAAYHMPKEILDTIRKRPIILKHFQDLQTHWSADAPNDPVFQAPIFRQFPAKSLILAPLRAKDGVIGVLACAWWTRRHRVTREEISLMESLAGPAAVAIENARLYAKAAQAAVDQERVRVDRILHDTLRQTVFSMAMKIEMALMGSNKASALRAALRGLKQDAAVMMTQMREVVPPGEMSGLGWTPRRRSRVRP
jgi:GAF domain-containing protein